MIIGYASIGRNGSLGSGVELEEMSPLTLGSVPLFELVCGKLRPGFTGPRRRYSPLFTGPPLFTWPEDESCGGCLVMRLR